MFFRVPGNRASALKIEYLAGEVYTELSPAAGAQVSSGTCAEAIWAQWQERGQAGKDPGRAGTMPWGEIYFPAPQSRGYEKGKHQRRQRSPLLGCFFTRVGSCQGLSRTRELNHVKQKRLWGVPPVGASDTTLSLSNLMPEGPSS